MQNVDVTHGFELRRTTFLKLAAALTTLCFCFPLTHCLQKNAGEVEQMIQERLKKVEKLQDSIKLLKVLLKSPNCKKVSTSIARYSWVILYFLLYNQTFCLTMLSFVFNGRMTHM